MKKIVKYSCLALILTGIFAVFNTSAKTVNYADLKIPAMGYSYTSGKYRKSSDSRQIIRQVSASNPVKAKIFTDSGYTQYETLVTDKDVVFGANSATPGDTWVEMKTTTPHLFTTSFYGNWFIG